MTDDWSDDKALNESYPGATKPSPEAIIGNWKQEIVGEADASLGKYNAAEIIKALTDAGYVIVNPSPAPEASVPCPVCGVDMIHRCGTKQGRLDA